MTHNVSVLKNTSNVIVEKVDRNVQVITPSSNFAVTKSERVVTITKTIRSIVVSQGLRGLQGVAGTDGADSIVPGPQGEKGDQGVPTTRAGLSIDTTDVVEFENVILTINGIKFQFALGEGNTLGIELL